MAIIKGTDNINTVYFGNNKIGKIYLGNELVYQSEIKAIRLKNTSSNSGTIGYTTHGTLNINMQYSTNGTSWNTWTGENITIESGKSIYIRNLTDTLSTSAPLLTTGDYLTIISSNNITLDVSGDIKWLVNGNENLHAYSFFALFSDNTAIVNAENLILSYTLLNTGCYSDMFTNCTSLIVPPKILATKMAYSCFEYMFSQCTNLVSTPEITISELDEYCFCGMFSDCKSLKKINFYTKIGSNIYPGIIADYDPDRGSSSGNYLRMKDYAFVNMFYNCFALKVAETSGVETTNSNTILNWQSSSLYTTIRAEDMFTGTGGTFTGTPSGSVSSKVWYRYDYYE